MKSYPIAKPFITAKDKKSVLAVLNTDNLSLGPKYREFEKKFAQKLGVKYACAVSSGTAGLHLMMIASGIKKGDEVITSPFSFIASANSILYVGAKPVFVDIDPETFNIDPKKIEEKITKRTKAILVVHIFGQTAEMAPILKLAKKYKLKIIEDACESIGATYKGKKAGVFGESAVFAFYPNKQMTTGEGGMIITNQKRIYDLCSSLRNQGRAENMQWLDHKYLGYNYRLDEMSAALGVSQLEKLDFMIKERRKIAGWYNEILAPFCELIQTPGTAKDNTHTWFVYAIKIKDLPRVAGKAGKKINRDQLMENLKKAGVSAKPYLPSIHLFDFYKKRFGYKKGDFPISEEISACSLALPLYIGLTKEDCRRIAGKLLSEINKLKK